MRLGHGNWTENLTSQPMPYDYLHGMRRFNTSPVVSVVALRCVSCCWQSLKCCYWTSPRTILMLSRSHGLNVTLNSIQVLLLPLRMIVIFWITLQAGYSNWIVATAFLGREIIPRGWSKRINASRLKRKRNRHGENRSQSNWNGLELIRGLGRQKVRHVCSDLMN